MTYSSTKYLGVSSLGSLYGADSEPNILITLSKSLGTNIPPYVLCQVAGKA